MENEALDEDLVARWVGDKGAPKAGIAVREGIRPADVAHGFIHVFGAPSHVAGLVSAVVSQHRVERDGGERFSMIMRNLDTSESYSRVNEMLIIESPQFRRVSGPEEHLLLQDDRTIDAASPTLRNSPDVEKRLERQERQYPLEKLFCFEDTFTCGVRCVHDDETVVGVSNLFLLFDCVGWKLCDSGGSRVGR